MSIKVHDPELPILLVHDENSIKHLTETELGVFDILKTADLNDYTIAGKKHYQRLKLCVNKYTDFENTLYIDVDTMWFPRRSTQRLIDELSEFNFYIGKNGQFHPLSRQRTAWNYTWWEEPLKICKYFKLKNWLPQTISGVFFFKKNEYTEKIFNRAQEIYDDPKAPCKVWGGGKPDEYCFNVALSEVDYEQEDAHFVFFEAVNGNLNRKQIYDNFWGIATGGTELAPKIRKLYDELVDLYNEAFTGFRKLYHRDKEGVILERRK